MLNPLRILRQSSKITVATAISVLLNFPLSIFVARMVLPDELGQVNFVALWMTYANLISPGIFAGGQREMIHRQGQGDTQAARQAQNVGFSGEMLWSILPAAVILLASTLFSEPLKHWGLVLVAVTFFLANANKLVSSLHLSLQHFDLYARLTLVRVVLSPVLIVVLIFRLGPFALLIAPLVAEGLVLALYLTRSTSLGLAFEFNRIKLIEFVRAGFPLALATLVYWAYRLTGQSSVALWFSAESLAFYTLSASLVTLITRASGDFSGVLMPVYWRELGEAGVSQRLYRQTTRVSVFVMLATCAMANMAQAGFAPLVQLVLPRYVASIPVFEILAFNIIVLTMTFIPSLLLDSAVVNRQWAHLSVWAVGLGINIVANILVTRLGGGLQGIAWNDIWIQLMVVVVLYALAEQYMYPNRTAAIPVYITITCLLGIAGLVFAVLQLPLLTSESPIDPAAITALLAARIGLVLLVWGTIAGVVVRLGLAAPASWLSESG